LVIVGGIFFQDDTAGLQVGFFSVKLAPFGGFLVFTKFVYWSSRGLDQVSEKPGHCLGFSEMMRIEDVYPIRSRVSLRPASCLGRLLLSYRL
jgi:hypothetical protein